MNAKVMISAGLLVLTTVALAPSASATCVTVNFVCVGKDTPSNCVTNVSQAIIPDTNLVCSHPNSNLGTYCIVENSVGNLACVALFPWSWDGGSYLNICAAGVGLTDDTMVYVICSDNGGFEPQTECLVENSVCWTTSPPSGCLVGVGASRGSIIPLVCP